MKLSRRTSHFILILLPVTLTACTQMPRVITKYFSDGSATKNRSDNREIPALPMRLYPELAQRDPERPTKPSFRLSGTSRSSRSHSTDRVLSRESKVVSKFATASVVEKSQSKSASSQEDRPKPRSKMFRLVAHDGSGNAPAVLPAFVEKLETPDGEQTRLADGKATSSTVPPAPVGSKDAAAKKNTAATGKPDAGTNAPLSLSDLEAIAVESNPSLMQIALVVEKARGIHEQVGLYPNPVVGYSANEIGNDGKAGQQGGGVSQTIVTGNKLRLNREVASWNIQELSWEYQTQRYRVINDVALRYYDVLGAQKRLTIAAELLKVAENGVKIAEQLLKAKQASRADVLQATFDLNQIRIIQQNAKYEYAAAWKRLAAVLGRPQLGTTKLAGSLKGPAVEWQWEPTYQKLLEESPQIQAARSRIQGARLSIQRQEAQPIPNILTQVSVARDNNTRDVIANVQIGLPLPIFNRNQGTIRLARAEYRRAIRDVERLELQLRDRLATAFRDFQQAKYQVQQYQQNILSNAEESRKLTEESYQAGQVNFLRVLTARRTYFEANLRSVDAQIALRKANVVIDGFVLTGGLTDVPDIGKRILRSIGIRGKALSGQ